MGQNKKIILVLVAFFVIAALAYAAYKYGWLAGKNSKNSQQAPKAVLSTIKDLPESEIPPEMPLDIILPKNAQIVHVYTAKLTNGNIQSTLIFSTDNPSATSTIFSDYLNYLAKNHWALLVGVASSAASPAKVSSLPPNELSAKKDNQTINIDFENVPKSRTTITTINLISSPNKQ